MFNSLSFEFELMMIIDAVYLHLWLNGMIEMEKEKGKIKNGRGIDTNFISMKVDKIN